MGRYSTWPTTVEDCLILSMKDLREWGYLKPNSFRGGTVTVSRGGRKTASYGITVSTFEDDPYIRFNYTITKRNGEKKEIDYKVKLVTTPANRGNGVRYYFFCPHTGKKCFKLYSPPREDYFLHRDSFPYLIYEKQKESKRYRAYDKSIAGMVFVLEKLENEMIWERKKYQKNYYKGKPTKKMKKYLELRDWVSNYTKQDIHDAIKEYLR